MQAAGLADDAEFVRRIRLDLHGTVPMLAQTQRFLADAAPDKLARLVDSVLADERYGRHLAGLLELMTPFADDMAKRADRFRDWLAGQFDTKR